MPATVLVLAQDPTPAKGDQPQPNLWGFGGPGFMFVVFGLFMVFMIWMPARRQRKEQAQMLASLKPGRKVVTSAGIVGTIAKVADADDELVIRSEDTKVRVLKSSILRVLGDEAAETKS
ncbi:MAG: preprotein translocase subunit YajC [Gemmataceae bacterium]